jgi:hypothetical protein
MAREGLRLGFVNPTSRREGGGPPEQERWEPRADASSSVGPRGSTEDNTCRELPHLEGMSEGEKAAADLCDVPTEGSRVRELVKSLQIEISFSCKS